jgi:poly(hydroxyalkanoate) depolymerase family esterase
MSGLGTTIGNLSKLRQGFSQALKGVELPQARRAATGPTRLKAVSDFGSNPGNLRMYEYVPKSVAPSPALMVVLHGCTQTAAGYDHGTGWSTLADEHGFVLLYPEQQPANNPNTCFNWFEPGDIRRDAGEAKSIRQMIDRMIADHGVDGSRVYITGLSAGGAMAGVMLATYPEMFAGGGIIAGLPYGTAGNVQDALASMFQGRSKDARQWGDLVRAASPHRGPWPKISVWHGGADTTVKPMNATETVKQWSDVHGVSGTPALESKGPGFTRQAWRNGAGEEVVESFTLAGMAHGTPLAAGTGEGRSGVAGPYLLDVGVSSTHHIASFLGLIPQAAERPAAVRAEHRAAASAEPAAAASAERPAPAPMWPPTGVIEFGRKHDEAPPKPEPAPEPERHGSRKLGGLPIDVNAVITKALKAAGLMRS